MTPRAQFPWASALIVLGGLLIGLAENLGVLFISPGYKDGIAFVIMVIILLARPYVVIGERSD